MSAAQALPRVTVISAWFNRPEDIVRSLDSVLSQEGVSFEYVIVDDASTCLETQRALAAVSRDPRVTLLRNERNVGFTRSLCRAAEAARGEVIALHDAGDISMPGRLRAQLDFLDSHPDHVLVGARVEEVAWPSGSRTLLPGFINHPFDGIDGLILTHGEVMYRAEAYRAVGGYRPLFYYSQDSDLWRRLKEIGDLGQVDEVLYERRTFDSGIQGNPRNQVSQAIFGNLALVAAEARARGEPDPVERLNALAILRQPHGERFRHHARNLIRGLLRERRFAEAVDVMSAVPAGMLSVKMICLYALLRLFFPARREPLPKRSSAERAAPGAGGRGDVTESRHGPAEAPAGLGTAVAGARTRSV